MQRIYWNAKCYFIVIKADTIILRTFADSSKWNNIIQWLN